MALFAQNGSIVNPWYPQRLLRPLKMPEPCLPKPSIQNLHIPSMGLNQSLDDVQA